MLVYISYKALDRTNGVDAARIADDVNAVRLNGQLIDNANRIWESYAIKSGGNVIEQAGSKGAIQIEAESLLDLNQVVNQYSLAVDMPMQVGIGMKLSESNQALTVLIQRGKEGTLLWDPTLSDQLAKADELKQNKGDNAGFEGHHTGSRHQLSDDKPHSEVGTITKEIKDAKSIAPKEKSTEANLHAHAKEQSKKDQAQKVKDDSNTDKLKGQLVQILQQIKTQTDELAQLKQVMPDVYQSLTSLVQNVILLGKEVFGNDIQKTEEVVDSLNKAISTIQPGPKVDLKAPDMGEHNAANPFANKLGWDKVHTSFDYSHLLPDKAKAEGLKMAVHHHYYENFAGDQKGRERVEAHITNKNGVKIGHVQGVVRSNDNNYFKPRKGTEPTIEPHSELHPDYKGRGLGTAAYEAVYSHAKNVLGINKVDGGSHSQDADNLHKRLSKKHGFRYVSKKYPDAEADEEYPFQPYSYTLKSEFADLNEDLIFGKGHGVIFLREPLDKSEDDLFKGLGDIAPGKGTPISIKNNQWGNADAKDSKSFDYSHVIPEKTRGEGYKLHVNHGKHGNLQYFTARVMSPKGENVGYVQAYNKGPNAIEPHSFIEKSHRGKGLGISMYEALYSRAKESGITQIKGGEHSEAAAKVHRALSKKHGLSYGAKPNPGYGDTTLNEKGPYSYALKAELDPHSVEEDPLDKGGASGETGQHPSGLQPVRVKHMPPGTVDGQKVKVKTPDGVGWISARKGLVTSAVPTDSPLLGASGSPASPQSKDAKGSASKVKT